MSRLCAFLFHHFSNFWYQLLRIVVLVLFCICPCLSASPPEIVFSIPRDGQIIRANNGLIQVQVEWLNTVKLDKSKIIPNQNLFILKVNGNVIASQRTGVFLDVPVLRGSNIISVVIEDHLGAVIASSKIEVMILKVSKLMRPK